MRQHAVRALEEARLAGNAQQIAEAEELIAQAVDVPAPVPVRTDGDARTLPPRDLFGEGGS